MLLLVGLGNPGPEYAGHRHNVGFMALERLAQVHRFGPWRRRFQGEVAEGRLDDDKCLLLKPLTYMNESGRAVGEAMRFFKLAPEDIAVFYDEIDLAPGKVRVKRGGGAAGHNGIRSMIAHVGPDFVRVRIGVGHPGHKDRVIGHVLHDFSGADRDWLGPVLDAMADAAPLLAEGADDKFQTRVAFLTQPPETTSRKNKES
jgi:PTH1 family peptidyl-tRNA hydrolase